LPICLFAQKNSDLKDHTTYLNILNHSRDSLYTQLLANYDRHIKSYPEDYKVQIEKCRFIGNAYYDYSEDYNPKYEESEQCAKELVSRFPDTPEVLLFRSESLYGDSAIKFLKKLELKIDSEPTAWKNFSWKVYESMANNYQTDSSRLAIKYGEMAMEGNDSLDLTLMLGRVYKGLGSNQKAVGVLSSRLNKKQRSWELNQKGKLLLELGAIDSAIHAFNLAKKDSTGWEDAGSLAQALLDKGLVAEARDYLVKDAKGNWNNDKALYKLFEYDIKFGIADSASRDYKRLTENEFWNDPVGFARIRLFFKAPSAPFAFVDVLRILMLLIMVGILALLPYLWILPIHYFGTHVRRNHVAVAAPWGLRHLWAAFSIWFIVEFIILSTFDYLSVIAIFNKSVESGTASPISYQRAQMSLYFFLGIFLSTMAFVKREDVFNLWQRLRLQGRNILLGVGLALALRVGLVMYLSVVNRMGWFTPEGSLSILSINEDILSINQYYHPLIGFLVVVLLGPLYEEILFRGVFLSACKKYLHFFVANSLQAFTFALAHNNLKLFIFYFSFGLIAGHFQNRTQSLATGWAMHVTNNLIAFFGILALQKTLG